MIIDDEKKDMIDTMATKDDNYGDEAHPLTIDASFLGHYFIFIQTTWYTL